ncbi:hypothetical protein K458DRAFT_396421 [Lentithecium fluviatile CBS 122367]|uniref:Uncharacterized protein n=1 Tax=Lentithecium fluviatile CBS 122367 TaxID=1168545 RepID=A0A6G1IFS4_9PLEO|nr:hypothetical protein K458DRAFT_396421 [Lentithecium fluviatile CBS 122367]
MTGFPALKANQLRPSRLFCSSGMFGPQRTILSFLVLFQGFGFPLGSTGSSVALRRACASHEATKFWLQKKDENGEQKQRGRQEWIRLSNLPEVKGRGGVGDKGNGNMGTGRGLEDIDEVEEGDGV